MPAWLSWLPPFILATATTIPATALADHSPYQQSDAYDTGLLGSWPTETYRSSPLLGPSLNYIQHSALCNDDDGLYTLLAPRGYNVRTPGPMIIDQDGHLVWTKGYGQTHGVGVSRFRGTDYLTFGVENDGIRGFGDGVYYMVSSPLRTQRRSYIVSDISVKLDSSYEEVYKIKGANGMPVDLREFHITRDETAVISAFEIKSADLRSAGGLPDGQIYDCIVQEIEIETGKLLFQWRASEHVDFTQIPRDVVTHVNHVEAWDFFHLNSIDKDGKGNFLVSSATTDSLIYIDGSTGGIIWTLGGKNNSFEDLSNGAATQFSGQHHARFQDNDTAITLFDNHAANNPPDSPSRGLYLDLNLETKTVQLRHEYTTHIHSPTNGGSLQLLPSGNILQGYGLTPAWTEFSTTGDILCHVHFGPASSFNEGRITSDRISKYPWIGLPKKTSPDIALYGYEAAVSWNGATEVTTYVLQGTDDPELDRKQATPHNSNNSKDGKEKKKDFTFLTALPKTGFETILPIPETTTPLTTSHLRILALNAHGDVLGITKLTPWDPTADQPTLGTGGPAPPGIDMRPFTWFVVGFLVAAGVAVGVWVARRRIAARRVLGRIRRRRGDNIDSNDSDGDGDVEGGWWDEEDGELSDDELIDAVEFSLLGGRALRARGLAEDDDEDEVGVGDERKGPS